MDLCESWLGNLGTTIYFPQVPWFPSSHIRIEFRYPKRV